MQVPRLQILLSGAWWLSRAHTQFTHHREGHDHQSHAHLHVAKSREQPELSPRDISETPLAVEIINNTPHENIHVYILTNYDNGIALITSESQFFSPRAYTQGRTTPTPEEANLGIPLGTSGSTKRLDKLPIQLLSARIVISVGTLNVTKTTASLSMPGYLGGTFEALTDWSFIEANVQDDTLYVNPTFVDFAGLPLDFDLTTPSSTSEYTGLLSDGIGRLCQQLREAQAEDGQPWSDLCLKDSNGGDLRIKSPAHDEGFDGYWDKYIEQVWQHYSSTGLAFVVNGDTKIECRTDIVKEVMTCNGTSAEFAKPTSSDIWGCDGSTTFGHSDPTIHALGPAFCAAIHRGTLLVPGGETQPCLRSDKYYPPDQRHNKYASLLHVQQFNHTGYAFPYDDVKAASDDDVSGLLAGSHPTCLRIYVGGRSQHPLVGSGPSPSDSLSMSPSFTNCSFDARSRQLPTKPSQSTTVALSSTTWSSASPLTGVSWAASQFASGSCDQTVEAATT